MATTKRSPKLIKLGKLANSQKYEALEEAWLAAVEAGDPAPGDLLPIAGQIGRQGQTERAESLLGILLGSVEQKSGPVAALMIARVAARQLPVSVLLRKELTRLYPLVHPEYSELAQLLERLFEQGTPLDEAVVATDAYLHLRPGAYVADRTIIEPGIVEEVNSKTGVLTVSYDGRHQEYGVNKVLELVPLPADHFRALALYAPERLRGLAESEPVEFVLLALQTAKEAQIGYRDLKSVVTRLLGEKAWVAWWKEAKLALKRAPLVALSSGSQPRVRLLKEESRYEDRIRLRFDHLKSPTARLELVLAYLDETSGNVISASARQEDGFAADLELLAHLGNGAAKMAVAALKTNAALALAALAVHAEVAERGVDVARPNPRAATQVLAHLEDPALLVEALPEGLLLRTLEYLRRALPDGWPTVWSAVLVRAGRRVTDVMVRGLLRSGHQSELTAALEQVVERPTVSPEALCWLWRTWHSGGLGERLSALGSISNARMLTALLNLADAAGRYHAVSGDERHRRAIDSVRQALALQNGDPVRAIFDAATPEDAARYKSMIASNSGLAAAGRSQLLNLLRARHADLFLEDLRPWREDAVYTTEVGLRERQAQLDAIIKIDIPAVARQIGEAAAFGDLSENAEYTAALEKRDQLTSRATRMEEELSRAQIITSEMANSPFVSVGTRVTARELSTSAEESYTFLGPWDADPEQGILDYKAPLSLAFMGKKPGEEVVYGEGDAERRWEVLRIVPAV
jgi:transcription elongation factor GreA